jgi:hypothetical protein
MLCTFYVQRSEGKIKVAFGRVFSSDENVTVHDVIEGCKHVIISFSADENELIGDLIQAPLIWPIELVQLVDLVIN